jgi:hypothetical protein
MIIVKTPMMDKVPIKKINSILNWEYIDSLEQSAGTAGSRLRP